MRTHIGYDIAYNAGYDGGLVMEGFYRDMVVSVLTGTLLGMLLSVIALMLVEVR